MKKMVKCKACGADIAKTANRCPNCGARQHTLALTACVVIIVITIFSCCAILIFSPSSTTSSNEQEPIVSVSAEEIYSAYQENEVNADSLYNGNVISISGTISDITTEAISGDPCVCLDSGDSLGIYPIQCFFGVEYAEKISGLSDGETITIIGECTGNNFGIIQLTGCSI